MNKENFYYYFTEKWRAVKSFTNSFFCAHKLDGDVFRWRRESSIEKRKEYFETTCLKCGRGIKFKVIKTAEEIEKENDDE
jgi:hypothetical protein